MATDQALQGLDQLELGPPPDKRDPAKIARKAWTAAWPKLLAIVHAETSTGSWQPIEQLGALCHEYDALLVADTVTSLGCVPVSVGAWGVDATFSCSQKGLSCPAGLSPVSISRKAYEWLLARPEEPYTWYLDLALINKYFEPAHKYHHTPSTPLYYAMHQALAVIEEEGLQNRWARHKRANRQLLAGLANMGFQPFVKDPENRIWHLTTVVTPAGVDEAVLRQRLLDRFSIEIASGLGQLSGKILRVGTMGPLATEENVDFLLESIAACLSS